MGKAKIRTTTCIECKQEFNCRQNNPKNTTKYCPDCASMTKKCKHEKCNKMIPVYNTYCSNRCSQLDPLNFKVIEGHKAQGKKLTGENNPAKRPEVRKKISILVTKLHKKYGALWKKGKTDEEIEKLLKTKNRINAIKKYDAIDGDKYRSRLECKVVSVLVSNNITYEYEKRLPVNSHLMLPDFTLPDLNGTIIEVTGCAHTKWRAGFMDRIKEIRGVYPNKPIFVITYPEFIKYLLPIANLVDYHIYAITRPPKLDNNTISLFIGKDDFKFDYMHVLPQHKLKCKNIHGHSGKINVKITGHGKNSDDMLIDFKLVKDTIKTLIDNHIDHKFIINQTYATKKCTQYHIKFNDIEMKLPIENVSTIDGEATAENMSIFLARNILKKLPLNIIQVEVEFFEGFNHSATGIYNRSPIIHSLSKIDCVHFIRALKFHSKYGRCVNKK